jgi:hypothetical protein
MLCVAAADIVGNDIIGTAQGSNTIDQASGVAVQALPDGYMNL